MNTQIKWTGLFMLSLAVLFNACKDNEDPEPMDDSATLTLNLSGLEDLDSNSVYEGWIIVNGSPVTTGTFTIDANGDASRNSFTVAKTDLMAASTFVLTIEPRNDPDPAPSHIHILAGDFNGNAAGLAIDHMAALNNDFTTASGKYILATPTDTDSTNEESGLWFVDNSSGSPMVGLGLPTLPMGWVYEGWVVIEGFPVSTGTFSSVDMADDVAPYSGTEPGPPFPGEDFLMNAPIGLNFPTDLRSGKAVISIEPVPDNSPMPFVLKPLVADIASMAPVHTVKDMIQNLSFPAGTASR